MLIVFLRGINVSGKNMLKMPALEAAFRDWGAADVRSYIQSGNLVCTWAKADRLTIQQKLNERFGLEIPVVLRTGAEMTAVVAINPYPQVENGKLMVYFLSAVPDAGKVASLDPQRSPPDEYVVIGKEIYAHCPNGFGKSKLTIDYFEKRLGVTATARNWNTVTKMEEWGRQS